MGLHGPTFQRLYDAMLAVILLNLHLITLLNDPNLRLVHLQEAGGEIH